MVIIIYQRFYRRLKHIPITHQDLIWCIVIGLVHVPIYGSNDFNWKTKQFQVVAWHSTYVPSCNGVLWCRDMVWVRNYFAEIPHVSRNWYLLELNSPMWCSSLFPVWQKNPSSSRARVLGNCLYTFFSFGDHSFRDLHVQNQDFPSFLVIFPYQKANNIMRDKKNLKHSCNNYRSIGQRR